MAGEVGVMLEHGAAGNAGLTPVGSSARAPLQMGSLDFGVSFQLLERDAHASGFQDQLAECELRLDVFLDHRFELRDDRCVTRVSLYLAIHRCCLPWFGGADWPALVAAPGRASICLGRAAVGSGVPRAARRLGVGYALLVHQSILNMGITCLYGAGELG